MNDKNCCDVGAVKNCCRRQFSWTAVIVGGFVGVGIAFLLNLFSLAIGLSAFSFSDTGVMTIAVGGVIGLLIGNVVCTFTLGWVAGYLGRPYCVGRHLGILYGFVAWCIAFLMMVFLAGYLDAYVTRYATVISSSPVQTVNTNMTTVNNRAVVNMNTSKTRSNNAMVNNAAYTQVPNTPMQNITTGTWLVFALFFIGALASCFGGHCGMCGCGSSTHDDEIEKRNFHNVVR